MISQRRGYLHSGIRVSHLHDKVANTNAWDPDLIKRNQQKTGCKRKVCA